MILRDPAERAFSHYLHQLSVGLTRATFREHIEACARGGQRTIGTLYPFLEIGLYYHQVKRYLERFSEVSLVEPKTKLYNLYRYAITEDPRHPQDGVVVEAPNALGALDQYAIDNGYGRYESTPETRQLIGSDEHGIFATYENTTLWAIPLDG